MYTRDQYVEVTMGPSALSISICKGGADWAAAQRNAPWHLT